MLAQLLLLLVPVGFLTLPLLVQQVLLVLLLVVVLLVWRVVVLLELEEGEGVEGGELQGVRLRALAWQQRLLQVRQQRRGSRCREGPLKQQL